MARIPKRELEQIVKRDLPGYRLLSRGGEMDALGSQPEPDEIAPDIGALRRKYLGGGDAETADGETDAAEDAGPNTDDEIVVVQPDRPADPFDQQARPKTVVVSGKSKRVIGSQG